MNRLLRYAKQSRYFCDTTTFSNKKNISITFREGIRYIFIIYVDTSGNSSDIEKKFYKIIPDGPDRVSSSHVDDERFPKWAKELTENIRTIYQEESRIRQLFANKVDH